MTTTFMLILTLIVVATGVITLLDWLIWSKKRKADNKKQSKIVEYSRAFFPVLLLVLVIRAFVVQLYRVPTGSLEPTVLPGDLIIVNQFDYGLHFPIGNFTLLKTGKPKRGDIALFYWPTHLKTILVKRVIGLPGDHIVYKNKTLYINGKEMTKKFLGTAFDYGNAPGMTRLVDRYSENLDGVKHQIFLWPEGGETQNIDVTVPKGDYFMMGDNRDNSDDSRSWGFVPARNLIGRAFGIVLSWDPVHHKIRWARSGDAL